MNKQEVDALAKAMPKAYGVSPRLHARPLPNTLTNADGSPYRAGADEAMKDAKLREIVLLALGRVSGPYKDPSKEVFEDEHVVRVGDELIKQIKELMG